MAASYNFRSAFNGFNREDVVHYIEYINSKHTNSVNQLKSELAALQQENTGLRARPERDPETDAQLEALNAKTAAADKELAQLRQQLAEAAARQEAQAKELAEAKGLLEAAQAELAQVTAQRDAAMTQQEQAKRRNEEELEAYRRAERMERQARERTQAMYQRANGVLADATAKVDDASAQICGIADQVAAQLAILQTAVTGSKQALGEAAATLYAMRPENAE